MAADGPGAFQCGHFNAYMRSENKYNLPMGERQARFALKPRKGCSIPAARRPIGGTFF